MLTSDYLYVTCTLPVTYRCVIPPLSLPLSHSSSSSTSLTPPPPLSLLPDLTLHSLPSLSVPVCIACCHAVVSSALMSPQVYAAAVKYGDNNHLDKLMQVSADTLQNSNYSNTSNYGNRSNYGHCSNHHTDLSAL